MWVHNLSFDTSKTSSHSETTLSDIFNLDDNSDISRNIDDAVLHAIRRNMAQSTLPNKSIIFKTPMVSSRQNSY